MYTLHNGDCLDYLKTLPDNSIECTVTDPPAGIGFMGKDWDKDKGGRDKWIAWLTEIMIEVFRVLKPGGHAIVWSLPRTSHWTGYALENAGFEVRDTIIHIFGSGFPKSVNLGDGMGTALKPAHETWWLCRKPIEKGLTIAQNCQKWGTGGLDIDSCRIETDDDTGRQNGKKGVCFGVYNGIKTEKHEQGRFPANVIHDGSECVVALFPESEATGIKDNRGKPHQVGTGAGEKRKSLRDDIHFGFNDTGSAARFFYCAKASPAERNEGLRKLPLKKRNTYGDFKGTEHHAPKVDIQNKNFHPTVKPVELMSYLIKLISKEGHTVLDPFMGSGTTGVAAVKLKRNFIGCELSLEYFAICEERIAESNHDLELLFAD